MYQGGMKHPGKFDAVRRPGLGSSRPFILALTLGWMTGSPLIHGAAASPADQWRSEHRFIDLHQHIGFSSQQLARAVKIQDAAGLSFAVNLSGGTVTSEPGKPSAFEQNKRIADTVAPGRFEIGRAHV